MKIKPLGDRVVLKHLKAEEKTKGGIYLPDSAKEKPETAEVVAVGPGKKDGDKVTPMQVKKGDIVLCSRYSGTNVKIDGEEYLILSEDDILAVVD